MENLKNRLINKGEIKLSNINNPNTITSDDVLEIVIFNFQESFIIRSIFSSKFGNGNILNSKRRNAGTFESFERRLNKLIKEWNLEEVV